MVINIFITQIIFTKTYIQTMIIEWDENKNRVNQKKHGLSFEIAQLVFDDLLHISIQDRHTEGEERWKTIGKIGGLTVVLVAHTVEDEDSYTTIRIISARKATKHERKNYEQAN